MKNNDYLIISEIFQSIQGEGHIGRNSLFVRTTGCNLADFCTFCDSKFSFVGGTKISIADIYNEYKKFNCNYIIFTGGEPLLQQDKLISFMKKYPDVDIEIETNGTFLIDDFLLKKENIHFNVSLKLPSFNATNSKINTIIDDSINKYVKLRNKYFKFVISNKEDIQYIKHLQYKYNILSRDIYLMPEGISKQVQESKQLDVINMALENGFNFSPRYHILVWDTKRGV